MVLSSEPIGIIGYGTVGRALGQYCIDQGLLFRVYDKYQHRGTLELINTTCNLVFICVPTPESKDGSADVSAIEKTFAGLTQPGKTIVIKSTVPPGTTERMQQEYPNQVVLFNPEFLEENHANEQFADPDRQVLGYVHESARAIAEQLLDTLPKAPYRRVMSAKEAEMGKLANNAYRANQIVFCNELSDFCDALEISYEQVIEIVQADHRNGQIPSRIWQDGYRGAGGHCLPKDYESFLSVMRELDIQLPLFQTVRDINRTLLAQQNPSE